MDFCKKCGAPLKEGQTFCIRCGEPTAQEDSGVSTGSEETKSTSEIEPRDESAATGEHEQGYEQDFDSGHISDAEPVSDSQSEDGSDDLGQTEACPRCGSPIKPGQSFCVTCGASVSGTAAEFNRTSAEMSQPDLSDASQARPVEPHKTSPALIAVVCAVAAIIVFAIGFGFVRARFFSEPVTLLNESEQNQYMKNNLAIGDGAAFAEYDVYVKSVEKSGDATKALVDFVAKQDVELDTSDLAGYTEDNTRVAPDDGKEISVATNNSQEVTLTYPSLQLVSLKWTDSYREARWHFDAFEHASEETVEAEPEAEAEPQAPSPVEEKKAKLRERLEYYKEISPESADSSAVKDIEALLADPNATEESLDYQLTQLEAAIYDVEYYLNNPKPEDSYPEVSLGTLANNLDSYMYSNVKVTGNYDYFLDLPASNFVVRNDTGEARIHFSMFDSGCPIEYGAYITVYGTVTGSASFSDADTGESMFGADIEAQEVVWGDYAWGSLS